jgi:hypothetical protein
LLAFLCTKLFHFLTQKPDILPVPELSKIDDSDTDCTNEMDDSSEFDDTKIPSHSLVSGSSTGASNAVEVKDPTKSPKRKKKRSERYIDSELLF